MAIYSRILLSGSANGRPIPVAATATPGTLVHTAIAATNGSDEVYVWASNVTASPATLTIEFGGAAAPGDHIVHEVSIPANSEPIPIAMGQNVNGGVAVRAFSGTAGAINLTGFVNRIS